MSFVLNTYQKPYYDELVEIFDSEYIGFIIAKYLAPCMIIVKDLCGNKKEVILDEKFRLNISVRDVLELYEAQHENYPYTLL